MSQLSRGCPPRPPPLDLYLLFMTEVDLIGDINIETVLLSFQQEEQVVPHVSYSVWIWAESLCLYTFPNAITSTQLSTTQSCFWKEQLIQQTIFVELYSTSQYAMTSPLEKRSEP